MTKLTNKEVIEGLKEAKSALIREHYGSDIVSSVIFAIALLEENNHVHNICYNRSGYPSCTLCNVHGFKALGFKDSPEEEGWLEKHKLAAEMCGIKSFPIKLPLIEEFKISDETRQITTLTATAKTDLIIMDKLNEVVRRVNQLSEERR